MALNDRRQSFLADAMRLCAWPQIDGSLLMMRKMTFFWKSSSFDASMPGGSAWSWAVAAAGVAPDAAGADCASGGVFAQAGDESSATTMSARTGDQTSGAVRIRRLDIETRRTEVNHADASTVDASRVLLRARAVRDAVPEDTKPGGGDDESEG